MTSADPLDTWLADLERRHLAELTFAEVRRGLQALSTIYVEERHRLAGSALDGRGKRAAFALYYAPLHFSLVRDVVRELGAADPPPGRIVDLGCGTLAGGSAWALAAAGRPRVDGVELSGWAASEARATLRVLGLSGHVAARDLLATRLPGRGDAVLLGWAVNELPAEARPALLARLLEAGRSGARILVLEPIASRLSPWWRDWAAAFEETGGRADLWRFPGNLPDLTFRLARAAGLDPAERTARSLYLPGRPA